MKKAQITIFMMLGILILVAGFILIYSYINFSGQLGPTAEESVEALRGPVREVKIYVDRCIAEAALQGMEIIRLQGGYIEDYDREKLRFLDREDVTYVGEVDGRKRALNGLDFNYNYYWLTAHHLRVPSLYFIQRELATYITDEVDICVGDFGSFKEQAIDVKRENIDTEVTFDKNTVVHVNFPLEVSYQDGKYNIDEFIYAVPINFKSIYNAASAIITYEYFINFLEEDTKTLISLYSGLDSLKLPPFARVDTNFDCSFVTWNEGRVKDHFRDVLIKNIENIKIENTNFENKVTSGFGKIYESFIHDIGLAESYNLDIDFIYERDFGFDVFDVKPGRGQGVEGPDRIVQTKIPFLPQICTFKYQYKYDMQYPVLVKITDSSSADIELPTEHYIAGQNYTFYFPLMVNLCGNQNRICSGGPEYLDYGYELNETIGASYSEDFFCDYEQRLSGVINISATDISGVKRLEAVDVYYSCGNNQNCFIGRTDEFGVIASEYPVCANGIISLMKPGYKTGKSRLSADENDQRVRLFLERLSEINISLVKIDARNLVDHYYNNIELQVSNLSDYESAVISISGDNNVNYLYPDPYDAPVFLSSGNHELSILLKGDVTIRPSTIEYDDVEQDISFDRFGRDYNGIWVLGGLEYDWKIRYDDIKDKNRVVFYIVSEFNSNNLEAEEIINSIIDADGTIRYNGRELKFSQYKDLIKPRFE